GWFICRLEADDAGHRDIFVFLRCVAAYADRSDHLSFVNEGQTTLQRRCARQRNGSDTTVFNLIFENLARTAEDRRGAGLANAHVDAYHLRVVETFDDERISAVIHDNDDDRRVSLLGFRLRGSRYFFDDFESKNFLFRQLSANNGW